VFADHRELLGRKDLDLVVNATYSHDHCPVAIDFLRAGMNVVSEKPMAGNAADCQKMIDAARESGAMLSIFQQGHFAPYFVRIRQILDSGVLGRLATIRLQFGRFGRRWDWQCVQRFAGGCLRNTGPHPMEQALTLLDLPDGEIPTVVSRLDLMNSYGDAEDFAKVLLLAPGKPVVDLEVTSCNNFLDYCYLIEGAYGSLKATDKTIDYKYYDPEKAPERHLILESLRDEEGRPQYCSEKLDWIEKHEEISEFGFLYNTVAYYNNIYAHMTEGEPLVIRPERIKDVLAVMDEVHRQNPLPITV
jgi:predicted dehydrogenase